MSYVQNLASLLITVFSLMISANLYALEAQTTDTTSTSTAETVNGPVTVSKRVITTTVPAAKEVITTPTGYVSCTTIDAGWVDNNWIPEHRVCKYENSPEGVAWVDGYWSCTQAKMDTGECINWKWITAHWEKTYSVY